MRLERPLYEAFSALGKEMPPVVMNLTTAKRQKNGRKGAASRMAKAFLAKLEKVIAASPDKP